MRIKLIRIEVLLAYLPAYSAVLRRYDQTRIDLRSNSLHKFRMADGMIADDCAW